MVETAALDQIGLLRGRIRDGVFFPDDGGEALQEVRRERSFLDKAGGRERELRVHRDFPQARTQSGIPVGTLSMPIRTRSASASDARR
jgi:hypothetical protein